MKRSLDKMMSGDSVIETVDSTSAGTKTIKNPPPFKPGTSRDNDKATINFTFRKLEMGLLRTNSLP